jgi:hypothetical protein
MLFKIEKIKLMADYGCYPLWWASSGKAGYIDPERKNSTMSNQTNLTDARNNLADICAQVVADR